MTTVKPGHRTHNRRHWSEVRTRGTSTCNPCSCRYTNGLLAELKIWTLYEPNTRRRKYYKSLHGDRYARICARAERESKNKRKNNVTDTPRIEPTTSRARGVRVVSAVPIVLWIIRIYTDLTPKLLSCTIQLLSILFDQIHTCSCSSLDEDIQLGLDTMFPQWQYDWFDPRSTWNRSRNESHFHQFLSFSQPLPSSDPNKS